jgi:hypothetical protein
MTDDTEGISKPRAATSVATTTARESWADEEMPKIQSEIFEPSEHEEEELATRCSKMLVLFVY